MALLAAPVDEMTASLAAWAAAACGSGARVDGVRRLGGHSGQTYGFMLHHAGVGTALVARLAAGTPGGDGSGELLRQASLLRGLRGTGIKVPEVRDVCVDPAVFGACCLIVEMLPGQPLIMGPEGCPSWLPSGDRQHVHELAAVELARLHRPGVMEGLVEWGLPRTPADEIQRWTRALERSAEPGWSRDGLELGEALLASVPGQWTVGVCHGDYQTNNVLFSRDSGTVEVQGIIDWELAHVGAVELDLAWFLMMSDPEAWDPIELRGGVDLDLLADAYSSASGRGLANLQWFGALACYRMAAITGYQIRLHRTGRKLDNAWGRASSSMPRFLARARSLLEAS